MRNQDKELEAAQKEAAASKTTRARKAEKIASTEDQAIKAAAPEKQAKVLKSVKLASTEKPVAQENQALKQATASQTKDTTATKVIDQAPTATDKATKQDITTSKATASVQAPKDANSSKGPEINLKEKTPTSEADSPKEQTDQA